MKGKGVLSVTVGGKTLKHPIWVATVQDQCILRLDFLKAMCCQLDLLHGTVCFQEGTSRHLVPEGPA